MRIAIPAISRRRLSVTYVTISENASTNPSTTASVVDDTYVGITEKLLYALSVVGG
jgi:hypothetical protein